VTEWGTRRAGVSRSLRAVDLGYWNQETRSFTVEPGLLEIRVGSSSADIRLRKTLAITD
jgi:hypothetical protein